MSQTLVEKLENRTATEGDDYFSSDYKLSLLNDAKDHIINLGITTERRSGKTLRFLDSLRVTQNETLTPSSYQSFYKDTVTLPSDFDDYIFLDVEGINLAELNSKYELKHGNALPNQNEGYFLFYDSSLELYIDSDSYSTLDFRYIKDHSSIIASDTSIDDLDDNAEDVILMYAASQIANTDATLPEQSFKDDYNQMLRGLLSV